MAEGRPKAAQGVARRRRGLGSQPKPLPQTTLPRETVRAPRSGDPRFVRKPTYLKKTRNPCRLLVQFCCKNGTSGAKLLQKELQKCKKFHNLQKKYFLIYKKNTIKIYKKNTRQSTKKILFNLQKKTYPF